MRVKYYGVRGSLPIPGRSTIRYGGNTACVRIIVGSTLLILDGGSGLRTLGNELMQSEFGLGKGTAHILFSHAHWDHINGFPFFPPAYVKGNRLILYGSRNSDTSLKHILALQQNYINFPVRLDDMSASFEFIELRAGRETTCAEARISCFALNHPAGSFSYRIEHNSKTVIYATDYEHKATLDLKLVEFVKDADLLIYDTMFTPEDYEDKRGWGHSHYLEGIKIAKAAKVKQLHLFHYSPDYNDAFIDNLQLEAQQVFPDTYAAREGWEIEI